MKSQNKYNIVLILVISLLSYTVKAQDICDVENTRWYWLDADCDGIGTKRGACKIDRGESFSENGVCYTTTPGKDCNDNNRELPKRWYIDADGDGEGDPDKPSSIGCEPPTNTSYTYVDSGNDCDDDNPNVQMRAWYIDKDKDNKGDINSAPIRRCKNPSSDVTKYVTNNEDCFDSDPNKYQKVWYLDTDGDGFGEEGNTKNSCTRPGKNYYETPNDQCPGLYGGPLFKGCPAPTEEVDEPWNTIRVTGYDVNEKKISGSKSYYNCLGKIVQVQSRDYKRNKTWASHTLYDSQGRPALQTLSAPTNQGEFFPYQFYFKEDFIQKSDGIQFSAADFENNTENPSAVGTTKNSLGWYYSTLNTDEPYQDITDRPYARTIYSELNPGSTLKTIGGNKMNGQWRHGYSFTMPAGQELTQTVAFGDNKYDGYHYKIIKTVSRNLHGVENVVFSDAEGNVLAAARSGKEEGSIENTRTASILIGEQGYVDIHIPVGRKGISVVGHSGTNSSSYYIYDLITEKEVNTSFSELSNGFYRIAVRNMDRFIPNQTDVTYPENYYDYSLNHYDKAGRLLKSEQPLKDANGKKLASTFTYNSLGQLETTTSPDEGQAWFLYRKDGQIRFSTNTKQWKNKELSYTNYDKRGRPIESGVYTDNDLAFLKTYTPNGSNPFVNIPKDVIEGLDTSYFLSDDYKETHYTFYDIPNNLDIANAFGTEARKTNYARQSFVAGNVAKTSNAETTTWYSYDIYGRVQWIVQQIAGLAEVKTIDYEYDPINGQVIKVYFQKGHATEQFIHRYTYDQDDYSLVKVETSTNDTNYTEHARYDYYETGALKRVNLAEGLQGIDYVYNLQGALKGINHPNLIGSDPGIDGNDLFGMTINYYNGDYARSGNTPRYVPTSDKGIDQYNGNIKSVTWSTKDQTNKDSYYYAYNKNNWLTNAYFNHEGGTEMINYKDVESFSTPVPSGETQKQRAKQKIKWLPGFKVTQGTYVNAKTVSSSVEASDKDYDVSNITYDANGNIQTLQRNKLTENGSNAMDKLSYTYKADKPNQLLRVEDAVTENTNANDIKTQTGENYKYNDIGQLIEDHENVTVADPNAIVRYTYNASGLVTEVTKGNIPVVKFFYNDKNHRVRKESYQPETGTLNYTEHYVRDAAGTAMAIYRNGQVIENTIYGASRLGVRKTDGNHFYQLTDHLGNVRAVVGKNAQGQAMALTSATDYYPFGMPMPGKQIVNGEPYRYAYQGQEKDPETGKEAFQLRLWDARIGRWLTTDPYGQYSSPYLGMGNNPITRIDPDGGTDCVDSEGNKISCDSQNQTYTNATNKLDEVWISNKFKSKEDWLNSMYWRSYWSGFSDNFNAGWYNWDPDGLGNFLMKSAFYGISTPMVSGVGASTGVLRLGINGVRTGLGNLAVDVGSQTLGQLSNNGSVSFGQYNIVSFGTSFLINGNVSSILSATTSYTLDGGYTYLGNGINITDVGVSLLVGDIKGQIHNKATDFISNYNFTQLQKGLLMKGLEINTGIIGGQIENQLKNLIKD
ncbi:RHS repeat-associated core domain-containing protein [Tenacibaculum sp. 190524A02b]|uniref:RHS repeat domain-containing protein n=1 Tax=Tenacibaculum vairaonense TaxID=3137860 RepID=UPI0032B29DCF